MGFAEAEQTDRAVSTASDISWTYSLDLVDSLKPAGLFPLWDFENVFLRVGRKRKWWLKEKLWQCRCEDEGLVHKLKKGQSWENGGGGRRSRAVSRPFWQRVKDVCEFGAMLKKVLSWIHSHHGPIFTASWHHGPDCKLQTALKTSNRPWIHG